MTLKSSISYLDKNKAAGSSVLLAFYLALAIFKGRLFLFEGRFWAEEGHIYFAGISGKSFAEALLFSFNAHIEFLCNIIIYISTLVPLLYAPLVANWLTLLAQIIPVAAVIHYRDMVKLKSYALLPWIILCVGIPHATEVWINAINLQFHYSILSIWIFGLTFSSKPCPKLFRGLLFFSGLSGIAANFISPLFIIRAAYTKNKEHIVLAAIASLTCLFQIMCIATSQNNIDYAQNRIVIPDFDMLIGGLGFQQFLVTTIAHSQKIIVFSYNLNECTVNHNIGACWYLGAVACLFIYVYGRLFTVKNHAIISLTGAALFLLVSLYFVALSFGSSIFAVNTAGRYLYAPTVILFLAITIFVQSKRNYLFIVFLTAATVQAGFGVSSSMTGPSWTAEYNKSKQAQKRYINIWPKDWIIVLDRPLGQQPF